MKKELPQVPDVCRTMEYSSLALALLAGFGCGVAVGAYLAIRRRKMVDPSTAFHFKSESSFIESVTGDYKMVLVVRSDLKMGKGKVAAQCGHAAIGAYKRMTSTNRNMIEKWEQSGSMKVVVKAPDKDSFFKAAADASSMELNTHMVLDAGRTQIAPGSRTVLCVGPGPAKKVDKATGSFKLY